MTKEIVSTDQAPRAIGPYSQAVKACKLVFLSGQIPLDPASGELVAGTIEDQTARVMENLKAVLAACQLSLADIVKTTIFLTDMADFAKVNAVYGSYFSQQPPARSTVQVAALPKGARVEIEAVASQD
ncbi:MAG: RidA family protein [Desulfobacteraceae bacterium]|jgi:2-iminobutanoate/2-iminopropanoate deaminase|nr:RidA family protein [Desulfobacteraceae bacterium]